MAGGAAVSVSLRLSAGGGPRFCNLWAGVGGVGAGRPVASRLSYPLAVMGVVGPPTRKETTMRKTKEASGAFLAIMLVLSLVGMLGLDGPEPSRAGQRATPQTSSTTRWSG